MILHLAFSQKVGSNIQTSSDLSNFPEINNKTKIAFRLVSSFAIGSTQYAPISAASYSTKGTVQFDNIVLKGTKEASSTCNEISTKTSNIQVVKQTGFSGILRWNKGEGDSTLVLLRQLSYPITSTNYRKYISIIEQFCTSQCYNG